MKTVQSIRLDPVAVETARVHRVLTIEELAFRASVSSRTLLSARRGRPVGLSTARRIARVLGVGLRSLLADVSAQPGGDGGSSGGNAADTLAASLGEGLEKSERRYG